MTFDYKKVEYFDTAKNIDVVYAEIFGYKGSEESVTIPSQLDGIEVRGISRGAFSGCRCMRSLVISEGIRDISCEAFIDCKELECVIIPKSVTYIGNRAFMGCDELKSVRLCTSVEMIGERAFGYADLNTKIEGFVVTAAKFSVGCRYAKDNRFAYEKNGKMASPFKYVIEEIADLENESSIKAVCISAYCGNDENVIVPSEIDGYPVKVIDGCAFAKTDVKTVIIPDGADRILSGAFMDCKNLESVFLPETMSFIGSYAFAGCKKLTKVAVPQGAVVDERACVICA